MGPMFNESFSWPENVPVGMSDPVFSSVRSPSNENEFKLSGLLQMFDGFVLARLLSIIKNSGVIPINTNVLVLSSLSIDAIDFFSGSPSFFSALHANVHENMHSFWDVMPDWSKFFGGEHGSNIPDFMFQTIWQYITLKLNLGMLTLLVDAVMALIKYISDLFPETDAPSLGFNFNIAEEMTKASTSISSIISNSSISVKEKIMMLAGISIFGYSFENIFGGSSESNIAFPEKTLHRMATLMMNFVINFLKVALFAAISQIMSFIQLLGAPFNQMTQWLTLTFCSFLRLIGFDV